jgi:translation initiation factor 2B subunit (eIF-2B alpha/beta/delta family)
MATERIGLVFLRHDGECYCCRLPADDPVAPGAWSVISVPAEAGDDLVELARDHVADVTGREPETLDYVRTGDPRRPDETGGQNREFVPILFDVESRHSPRAPAAPDTAWLPPTAWLRDETLPGLWSAYQSVAPSVRSIAADDEHGAASLSVRALEVLRDRAAVVTMEGDTDGTVDQHAEAVDELRALAARLCVTRPSMAVVRNRLARALAGQPTPAAVEDAAIDGIDRAVAADAEAAFRATGLVDDADVCTLSWSGTVSEVLATGTADSVVVAESRPGCEGIDLAERLATALPVSICTDAAVAHVLASEEIDLVLVGADTLLPDGRVVNKTGTRAVAIAAAHEDCPVYVVTASDKVTTRESVTLEHGSTTALYDGDADLDVHNPLFDVTPPTLIDGIVTERGTHEPAEIEAIAAELSELEEQAGL